MVLGSISMVMEPGSDSFTLDELLTWDFTLVMAGLGAAMVLPFTGAWMPRTALLSALAWAAICTVTVFWLLGWALLLAWLALHAVDAKARLRQRTIARQLPTGRPSVSVTGRASTFGGSYQTTLVVVALMAGGVLACGTWAVKWTEFRALHERGLPGMGHVVTQDAFGTVVEVDGKEYDFFNESFEHVEVGTQVEVMVDPLSEHRPWSVDDADPDGWSLTLTGGAAALTAAAALYLRRRVPRRRIERVNEHTSPLIDGSVIQRGDHVYLWTAQGSRPFAIVSRPELIDGVDALTSARGQLPVRVFGSQSTGGVTVLEVSTTDGATSLYAGRLRDPRVSLQGPPDRTAPPRTAWGYDTDEHAPAPKPAERHAASGWTLWSWRILRRYNLLIIALMVAAESAVAWYMWSDAHEKGASWMMLAMLAFVSSHVLRQVWRRGHYGVRVVDDRLELVGLDLESRVLCDAVRGVRERPDYLAIDVESHETLYLHSEFSGLTTADEQVSAWASQIEQAVSAVSGSARDGEHRPVEPMRTSMIVGCLATVPVVAVALLASGADMPIVGEFFFG
jgi:hypothetical protein